MKRNRLSTQKHILRFAVILSALILAGCASTQTTTSSTSASSASSTVSTVSTSEESGADEADSTGGAMNGTIGSVIEANLSFKNKDFYTDYSTEDTVTIDLSAPKEADGIKVSGDGIKSTKSKADKGYVYIGGGTVNITAEQDGIQAETSVLISAGEVNVTAGGGSANGEQKTGNAMFGGAQNTTTDNTPSAKGIKAEAALDITGGTPPQMPGNTSET